MDLQNTAEKTLFDLSCQMWRLMQRKKQLLAPEDIEKLNTRHEQLWKQVQTLFGQVPMGRRNRIGFMATVMCS